MRHAYGAGYTARAPAAVFLAKRHESPEIDNPKADDCLHYRQLEPFRHPYAIGPHILPHFGGIYRILSTRLTLASLLLLQIGSALRVSSEPLAYEGILSYVWKPCRKRRRDHGDRLTTRCR